MTNTIIGMACLQESKQRIYYIYMYSSYLSLLCPYFEEVGGAYCFWDVCVCVCPSLRLLCFLMHSITSEPCMLGF